MLTVGAIQWKPAKIRGKVYAKGRKYICVSCPYCQVKRWISFEKSKRSNFTGCCRECQGNGRLGGWGKSGVKGKMVHHRGYWVIQLKPSDFFYNMCDGRGYTAEHRLVMAKSLGRNLHRWEIVHHKNGVKGDNRIENLQLVTDDRHKQITLLERRIKYLENKLTESAVGF